jgi:hypothetical protein
VQKFIEKYEPILEHPQGSASLDFLRALISPTSFTHGEMKKQSINRHVIDFADAFGVPIPHGRDEAARKKFRRLAAAKKPKPQLDFSI